MINLHEILSMAAVHAVYGKNRQALLWTGHETHCTHVTHPIHTLPAPTHSHWSSLTYCRATLCCQKCVWPTTRMSRGARTTRWGNLGRRRPAIIDNSRPWGLLLSAILGTDREHFVFEKLYLFHCENLNKTKLRPLKMYETNTWIANHN